MENSVNADYSAFGNKFYPNLFAWESGSGIRYRIGSLIKWKRVLVINYLNKNQQIPILQPKSTVSIFSCLYINVYKPID
jgi:hypothetical protein